MLIFFSLTIPLMGHLWKLPVVVFDGSFPMSLVENTVLLGVSLLRKFHEDSYNILPCNLISEEEYSVQQNMQIESGHLGTNSTQTK